MGEIQRLRHELARVQAVGERSGFMQRLQLQRLQHELARQRAELSANGRVSSEWLQARACVRWLPEDRALLHTSQWSCALRTHLLGEGTRLISETCH